MSCARSRGRCCRCIGLIHGAGGLELMTGCFDAVVFVLFTAIAWRHLPREFGCSPATANRRLAAWQKAGVWERLHRELLRRLNAAGKIDWATAVVDGTHIGALQGGSDRAFAG